MLLRKVMHRSCEVVIDASTVPPFAFFKLRMMFTCIFPYPDLWPCNDPYTNRHFSRGKQK